MNPSTLTKRAKRSICYCVALVFWAPALSLADDIATPERSPVIDRILLAGKPDRLNDIPRATSETPPPDHYARHAGTKPLAETHFLAVNAGFVGIFNRFPETLRYGAEFRWREFGPLKLRPSAGIVNAENDASYYFLGLRRDFLLSERLLLSGSFDAGYFEERDEIKLGLQMEFRSGAELSYRFSNEYRVGLALYHLSNGGFGDRNPGTESIVLSLLAPIQ